VQSAEHQLTHHLNLQAQEQAEQKTSVKVGGKQSNQQVGILDNIGKRREMKSGMARLWDRMKPPVPIGSQMTTKRTRRRKEQGFWVAQKRGGSAGLRRHLFSFRGIIHYIGRVFIKYGIVCMCVCANVSFICCFYLLRLYM
jgi:hypothetical protein